MNFIRAVSSEGFGRIRHFRRVRRALDADPAMRPYLAGKSRELPQFYLDKLRSDLGPMWALLPPEAIHHDPYAFLKKAGAAASASVIAEPVIHAAPPAPEAGRIAADL